MNMSNSIRSASRGINKEASRYYATTPSAPSKEREHFLDAQPPRLAKAGNKGPCARRFILYTAIDSIRSHSSSVTGMTDRREIRTSGNEAKALSALIAASV